MAVSTASKVLWGLGAVFLLAGIIVIIVAMGSGSAAVGVTYLAEGQKSFTLKVDRNDHAGFSLLMKEGSADCEGTVYPQTEIKGPEDKTNKNFGIIFTKTCRIRGDTWAKEANLIDLGHFFIPDDSIGAKIKGDYQVTSPVELWAIDAGAEFGEAVGGIFAAMGLMILAIVLIVVGLILLCVGCCCMNSGAA
jgi:hypothetical protein